MEDPQVIDSFSGEFDFLSNFHYCPVTYDGVLYASAENAYQAAKIDPGGRSIFLECTAGKAKRLGRKVKLRDNWDEIQAMRTVLVSKFTNTPYLGKKLIDTYPCQLIEGNTWGDRKWGVYNGKGLNLLGNLLMEIRATLINYDLTTLEGNKK